MTEIEAKGIADIFGGEAYQSGGGMWVVQIYKNNGAVILISQQAVSEFLTLDSFDRGDDPLNEVELYK